MSEHNPNMDKKEIERMEELYREWDELQRLLSKKETTEEGVERAKKEIAKAKEIYGFLGIPQEKKSKGDFSKKLLEFNKTKTEYKKQM